MNFNPLFLQNKTSVDGIHPEKTNKLSGSGYLFSDIINVFMNADETDSVAKLTQEFLGSAQIKETNGTPVILSLLGETALPLADVSNNLQLKIEDLLPSGLKKKLVKTEGENNNILEKGITVNKTQLAQILETINNLFKLGNKNLKSDSKNKDLELTETTELLENNDGVFLIIETADKIFNVNISKQNAGDNLKNDNESGQIENIYKIKFSAINENSLLNSEGNNLLANKGVNNSQLSLLPFPSELAAEKADSSLFVKLKVFKYQNPGSENSLPDPLKNKINIEGSPVKINSENGTKDSQHFQINEAATQNKTNGETVNEEVKILTGEGAKNLKTEAVIPNSTNQSPVTIEGKIVEAKQVMQKPNLNSPPEEVKTSGKIKSEQVNVSGQKSNHEKLNDTSVKTTGQEINPEKTASSKTNVAESVNPSKISLKDEKVSHEQFKNQKDSLNSEIKNGELKAEGFSKTMIKDILTDNTQSKSEVIQENKPELKKEVLDHIDETPVNKSKEKTDDNNTKEVNPKSFEKFAAENKENEQLNLKVAKAVKNITTIKSENTQSQNVDKTVKENTDTKINKSDDQSGKIQISDSNEKNYSQNENSSKQNEDNKNVPIETNRVTTGDVKEKFTLETLTPNSNSDRIVKAAEIMKEISKFIEKQDNSTLTIKISPEELGKVKITMDITEQSVKANIHVENEAVKTIIEKNISELQNQMSKSGIQLTSVNVMLSEGEQKTAKQFANKKKSTGFDTNDKNMDEAEKEKVKMMGYNTVEYLA
ncbi:MAG: flagellar hook-length control protein FliK [Bacteroidetes bacterium]|nr:flagellar hook-length control protein FliK [Bacteroidota bacterium]